MTKARCLFVYVVFSLLIEAHAALPGILTVPLPCEGFEAADLSADHILNEFSDAVFLVNEIGTAFLVDVDGGYLLTAFHVIKDIKPPFKATSESIPGVVFDLLLEGENPSSDVALLRIKNPDDLYRLSRITPLDIRLIPPNDKEIRTSKTNKMLTMGYPKVDGGNLKFRHYGATLNAVSSERPRYLEVEQPAFEGQSGSPLIDPTGNVVGVQKQQIGNGNLARYSVTADAEELLAKIGLNKRIIQLDEDLRGGKIGWDEFVKMLKKKLRTPTNLDLYLWSRRISQHLDDYSSLKKQVECLSTAMNERKLYPATKNLGKLAPPKERVAAHLGIASRAVMLGNGDVAEQEVKAAASIAHEAITSDAKLSAEDWISLVTLQHELGMVRHAKSSLAMAESATGSATSKIEIADLRLRLGTPTELTQINHNNVNKLKLADIGASNIPGGSFGKVFLPSAEGGLFAIDTSTGMEVWSKKFSTPVNLKSNSYTPMVFGNLVTACETAGNIARGTAYDASTGKVIWNRDLTTSCGAILNDQKTGSMYFPVSDSNGTSIWGIDATAGKVKWIANSVYPNDTPAHDLIVGDVVGDGKIKTSLFVLGDFGTIALDPVDGSRVKTDTKKNGFKVSPSTNIAEFMVWDPESKKIVPSKPQKSSVWSKSLTTDQGITFYGTPEGYLKAVDASNGREL